MLLVDTNILVAAADTSTPQHQDCVSVLEGHEDLTVPAPVVVETAWMIESRLGPEAEAAFVSSIAEGELRVVDLTDRDWARCRDLIAQYADLVSVSSMHPSWRSPSDSALRRSRRSTAGTSQSSVRLIGTRSR
jgi:predicted nucleic acid-binding protein